MTRHSARKDFQSQVFSKFLLLLIARRGAAAKARRLWPGECGWWWKAGRFFDGSPLGRSLVSARFANYRMPVGDLEAWRLRTNQSRYERPSYRIIHSIRSVKVAARDFFCKWGFAARKMLLNHVLLGTKMPIRFNPPKRPACQHMGRDTFQHWSGVRFVCEPPLDACPASWWEADHLEGLFLPCRWKSLLPTGLLCRLPCASKPSGVWQWAFHGARAEDACLAAVVALYGLHHEMRLSQISVTRGHGDKPEDYKWIQYMLVRHLQKFCVYTWKFIYQNMTSCHNK